jgi:carboxymethylenebutenolidase
LSHCIKLNCSLRKIESDSFISCLTIGSLKNEIEVALRIAEFKELAPEVSLLPPLDRKGYGPGLIVVLPKGVPSYKEGGTLCTDGIPPPLLKWSEEGFVVLQILEIAFKQGGTTEELLNLARLGLKECPECQEEDGIGLVGKQSQFYILTL